MSTNNVLIDKGDLRIAIEMLKTMFDLLHEGQPTCGEHGKTELIVETHSRQTRNITKHVPVVISRLLERANQPTWHTFMEQMEEWTDTDGAQHILGRGLGIFDPSQDFATELKRMTSMNNPLGSALHHCLASFVEAGVLEYDDDDFRYRAKPQETDDGY